MRRYIFIFISYLFFSSCGKSASDTQSYSTNDNISKKYELVKITYKQPINGYVVTILWKPTTIPMECKMVVGPAIIEMYNTADSTTATYTDNCLGFDFSRLNNIVDFKTEEEKVNNPSNPLGYIIDTIGINGILRDNIELTYKDASIDPFSFEDLNFDGKPELLLKEVANGQRGASTYKAYDLAEDPTSLYQITYQKPFIDLDDFSSIDNDSRRIIIHTNGGYERKSDEIYQLVPSDINDYRANFSFILSERRMWDVEDVTEKTYYQVFKNINGNMVEIKKVYYSGQIGSEPKSPDIEWPYIFTKH